MKADGELASGKLRRCGIAHERQRNAVAPHRGAGRNRDAVLAAEADRPVGPFDDGGAALLETHEHAVQRERLGAEYIGEAQPRLLAPDVRPHDQSEGLIIGPGLRGRKREPLIGLSRRIADRIRTVHGAGPAHDPFLALLCRGVSHEPETDGQDHARKRQPQQQSSHRFLPSRASCLRRSLTLSRYAAAAIRFRCERDCARGART